MEILTQRRRTKKAMLALAETNASHSFEPRFRVRKPSITAIREVLQRALGLDEPPVRVECFDISHIQGSDTVGSMVAWDEGRMKKSDYRKFFICGVEGVEDLASMREVIARRYSRFQKEGVPTHGMVLVDGRVGELSAATEAPEAL